MTFLRNYMRFIGIAVKINKLFCFLLLLSGLLSFLSTLIELSLVYFITEALQSRDITMLHSRIAPTVLAVGALRLLLVFVSSSIKKHSQIFTIDFEKHMFKKTMAIPFEKLESPQFISLTHKVDFSIRNQGALEGLLETSVNLLKSASILASMVLLFCAFLQI